MKQREFIALVGRQHGLLWPWHSGLSRVVSAADLWVHGLALLWVRRETGKE